MSTTYCGNCGTKNSRESRFCGECGAEIEAGVIDTIQCSGCGHKAAVDEVYCPECGTRIIQEEEIVEIAIIHCSSCDYTTVEDEKFCPECGSQMNNKIDEIFISDDIPMQTQDLGKEESSYIQKKKTHKPITDAFIEPKRKKTSRAQSRHKDTKQKKKRGGRRTIGKVALWFIAIVFLGIGGLYILGDRVDDDEWVDESQIEEARQNIADKEKELPPIKVIQANPRLSETSIFQVLPKNEAQVISYNDKIKVSLPPNFTNEEKLLSISQVKMDKAKMVEGSDPLALIDLTLNGVEQPPKPVEVSFKYDPSQLGSFSAQDRLEAFNWDKEAGVWVKLPIRIDEKENTAYAFVDHFSPIGFVVVTALKVGGAYVVDKILEEKLINDTYYTPEKNFKILYSKKAILADTDLNTKVWKNAPTGRSSLNTSNAPPYIQSVGYILEEALKSYTGKKYGFRNPAGKVKGYFGSYQKSITVKIDSWFNLSPLAQGEPNYEKLYERIHIPTISAWQYSPAKKTFAHELFHRIQAEYYGRLGMIRGVSNFITTGANCWWIESTAEYAAYHMAFESSLGGMENSLGNDYLEYPINKTGIIPKTANNYGWGNRDYEYISSIWVKYLVDIRKINLEKMIVADASDYWKPEHSLGRYLYQEHKISMNDLYRDFSNWMIFSPKGDLNHFNLASGNHQKDISKKEDVLKIGEGKEVKYSFNMPEFFTTKLWTIKIEKKDDNKILAADANIQKKSPMIVSLKKISTGTTVDIFIIPKGQRYPTSTTAVKTFYTDDQSQLLMLEEGELLCIMATQGVIANGSVDVIVRDGGVQLEISPSEILDAKSNETYFFEIMATGIPEAIKKVDFEWDFSDGTKKKLYDVDVVSESAQIEIKHDYKESDREESYPLKVLLKDSDTGVTLATAEARITLPLKAPSVFITERHLVGPPGATFDVEALASPENTYKFVWTVEGMAEEYTQTGKKSGIAPVINKIGEYTMTVKLYSMDNKYLATDRVTIYVEEDDLDNIDGIVSIDEDEKTKELTDIEDGKVKKVIYRCDTYYYGCNVGPAGTKMFENGLKEMEKMINDYTNEGNSKAAAKSSKRLAKMKSDFQLEKDTTSCNCQRKRTPTISYE